MIRMNSLTTSVWCVPQKYNVLLDTPPTEKAMVLLHFSMLDDLKWKVWNMVSRVEFLWKLNGSIAT